LGKKGGSTGLKRKPAPRFWPIHRKEFTWVVKPSPGPHSLQNCLPLAIVLRDILGFAQTRKEAKSIVSQGKVYVDGNWNVAISTWTLDYVVGSMITILIWIAAIFAIPAAIGVIWWIRHEMNKKP
jgi:ribosomal protein S4E